MEAREAIKKDHPKGSEAQCPVCWRIFTSDNICESHKRYPKGEGRATCVDPASLGIASHVRRNLRVWGQTQEEYDRRLELIVNARRSGAVRGELADEPGE